VAYPENKIENLKANIALTKRIANALDFKNIPPEVLEDIRRKNREYMNSLPKRENTYFGECRCAKCADKNF
jgi:hypothetical protein